MQVYKWLFIFLLIFLSQNIFGQITPPGMGVTNTASWLAFGVKQELDSIKKWESMSYIGLGRKSNPDNYDPLYKSGMFILNQEFTNKFRNNWRYSLALSYRIQDEYSSKAPYNPKSPDIKQEIRFYSRLSYRIKKNRLQFTPTIRQEFRKFYTPDFQNTTEIFQLRSRIRLQLALNLNSEKTQKIIASSEQLFSTSKKSGSNTWTNFDYQDSRFSLYYSLSPEKSSCIFNLGYMNNLIGYNSPISAHYLAFDVILKNPFK